MADTLPVGSLETILSAKDIEDAKTVGVPDWGCSVVVRGLTRGGVRKMREFIGEPEEADLYVLLHGLVEPKLSEAEARKILIEKSHGATELVLSAILDASNLDPGAVRAAQNSFLGQAGL